MRWIVCIVYVSLNIEKQTVCIKWTVNLCHCKKYLQKYVNYKQDVSFKKILSRTKADLFA
jgi:hypothetical protein